MIHTHRVDLSGSLIVGARTSALGSGFASNETVGSAGGHRDHRGSALFSASVAN